MVDYIPRLFPRPSSNRARCRATLLIVTNVLTTTPVRHLPRVHQTGGSHRGSRRRSRVPPSTMPSRSGCSPVQRPPRSAWRASVVDKSKAADYLQPRDVNDFECHFKVTEGQTAVSQGHAVSGGDLKVSSVVETFNVWYH